MNQTLPTCTQCSTSFWPNRQLSQDPREHVCDSCEDDSADLALSSDPTFALTGNAPPAPAEKRIEVIRPSSSRAQSANRLPVQPRPAPVARRTASPTPTPAMPQNLAFNCPACLAVLNISRDLATAGSTLSCPHCASNVIPPRLAPMAARRPAAQNGWRPGS